MAVKMYRQGDVLLVKVDSIPTGKDNYLKPRKVDRGYIAAGEVTGHHHKIEGGHSLWNARDNRMYVSAEPGAKLVHDEHGTIELEPGFYRTVIQVEYEGPGSSRMVRD